MKRLHTKRIRPSGYKASPLSILTVVVLGGVTACSGPTAATVGNENGPLVEKMSSFIQEYSSKPEFGRPGPDLDANNLRGKTIAIVTLDARVPALSEVTQGVVDVAGNIGLRTTVHDGGGSPANVHQGVSQAIDNGAAAIVSVGVQSSMIKSDIARAKMNGIPVIDVINTPLKLGTPGQGSDPNAFANVAPDLELAGKLIGASAIVKQKGDVHAVIMNTSELAAAPAIVQGIKSTLAECKSCTVVETDTALSQWSTELPSLATSTIRSNTAVNWLLPIFDGMATYIAPGIRQSGAIGKVHISSFNGTAAALSLAKKGEMMYANPIQNNEWAAWAAVDQAMRGMLKMEPADSVLPIRYVSTEDLKDVDVSTPQHIYDAFFGNAYKDGYKTLWKLS